MKKRVIALNKKLSLQKETIGMLDNPGMQAIAGGATNEGCVGSSHCDIVYTRDVCVPESLTPERCRSVEVCIPPTFRCLR